MKRIYLYSFVIVLAISIHTNAQTLPTTINYQGVLTSNAGVPLNGDYSISFRVYNVESGGSLLWQETKTINVQNGIINHQLGSVSALTLPFNTAYWLGITVASGSELTPRVKLSSVPYSIMTANIMDNTIYSSKIVDGSITGTDIANSTIGSEKLNFSVPILPIGTSGITDNAVTSSKIQDGAIVNSDISDNTITASKLAFTPGTGTVTNVVTGSGLTGGPVTTTGTISIATGGVTSNMIQDATITGTDIANSTIGTEKLNFSPATLPIGTTGIADNAVTSAKILDGTIVNNDIANGTISATKLNFTPGTGTVTNVATGSGLSGGPISSSGTISVANGGITSTMISDGTISSSDLGSNSVTSSKISDGAVSGSKISIPLLLSVPAGGSSYVLSVLNTSNDAILTTVSSGTGIRSQVSGTGTAGRFEGGSSGYAITCTNSGSNKDVAGISSSVTGGGSALVLNNNNSLTAYATLYSSNSNSSGYAGYFSGKVHVSGTLSKSAGSFKIDHPLDPENKYLLHSFVESPDMMNVYNGNILLNANGEASVQLPDWFEALNQEFRYQITPIGNSAPNLFISQEVTNSQFRIAGGLPNMKVSWQITGIRKDPYAEKNRIPVEELKAPGERGKYLNPEVFDLQREQGIGYKELRAE